MKRKGYLIEQIASLENIKYADAKARKGKTKSKKYIEKHDKNQLQENEKLSQSFLNGTYKTSRYVLEKIHEPKERQLCILPYYPDRIGHHSLMNILKPIWIGQLSVRQYSCIENRGIHKCLKDLNKVLRDKSKYESSKYCLKLDISKFYDNIDHCILKERIRRNIKDYKCLKVLDEIIDSVNAFTPIKGRSIPIGNYLSQFFANLYISDLIKYLHEELHLQVFAYMDDIVILHNSKEYLHNLLCFIKLYLKHQYKLSVKPNYQIFEVDVRGIDFVGYRFYHYKTILRKSILKSIYKLLSEVKKEDLDKHIASYLGWLKYCNSKQILQEIEVYTGIHYSNFEGICKPRIFFRNKKCYLLDISIKNTYYLIYLLYGDNKYIVKSTDQNLLKYLILNKHKLVLI